jgi:hypothetical protein
LAIYPNIFSFLLPAITTWIIYFFAVFSAFNFICVCFLFLWKKWAFFGLCGSAAVTLAANLYIGVGPMAIYGVLEVVITYLVLQTKWNPLEDFSLNPK